MTGEVDINDILKRSDINASPEEWPAERSARLQNERLAAIIHHVKDVILFVVLLVVVVGTGLVAGYEAFFDATALPARQQWAQTIFFALFSGSVSFLLGRKIGKED